MAFFDDLSKKISVTSKNVTTKAKGTVDIVNMKSQIAQEEKKIAKYCQNLGYSYYDLQKDNPLPELAELVGMISASFNQIAAINEQIAAIENIKTCPNCGATIEDNMAFCVGCGAKLVKPAMPNQPMQGQGEAPKFCISCGNQLMNGAMFCTKCGTKQN